VLLTTFGSIQGIRAATPEQIAELPGWSVSAAAKMLDALIKSDPTAPSAGATAVPSNDSQLPPDTET
jgi:hypothetical protein